MIVDLPNTTTSKITKKIVKLREQGGVVTLGRVLTLVVITRSGLEEEAIAAANLASREHPCRIIVLAAGSDSDETRLDGEIRVGGDAGASEVIVLRGFGELAAENESLVSALLLPDAPIVAWWPNQAPECLSTSPIGSIAHRRITDSGSAAEPREALARMARSYADGDTDIAWTRLTNWRIQLAAALDQYDGIDPITAVSVEGASDSPSTLLMAAWLQLALNVPVTVSEHSAGSGIRSVAIERGQGRVELRRPGGMEAMLTQTGQPEQRIALPRRSLQDCLAEELRRLDPDEVFGEVVTKGLSKLLAQEKVVRP